MPENLPAPQITRVILYVKDLPKVAAFYLRFFGMLPLPGATDGWLELASPAGGCTIALHQASVAQKSGAPSSSFLELLTSKLSRTSKKKMD